MKHAIALALVLFGLWLLLSGYFEPFLLTLGVLSVALVVWVAMRMQVLDIEGQPLNLSILACARYIPWLLKEIAKANVDVVRCILDPALPISPRVIQVPSTQRSSMTRTIYANSITLTPGTVSIDVTDDTITVHALTRESADGIATGDMGERATALEE